MPPKSAWGKPLHFMKKNVDLRQFCTVKVPDFTPLGGNRPDTAVVACVAVSLYTDGLPGDVLVAPDVLDTALAMLCSPFIVQHADDLQGREAHFRFCAVSVRLQTIDENVLAGLKEISSKLSGGISVAFQLDASVSALPHLHLNKWVSFRRADLTRTSVKEIGPCLFHSCSSLTSVKMSRSLTEVGDDFLSKCVGLQCMDLRQTELARTGVRFLHDCSSVTSLQMPMSLTEVGDEFAKECVGLQCIDLQQTQLTRTGAQFLAKCSGLRSVVLPQSLTEFGDYFLAACDKLERIELQHTTIHTVSSGFASECFSLTTVTLPDTVTEIGRYFLLECDSLQSIDLQNTALKVIGSFFGMRWKCLTSVLLPDTVTKVGGRFLYESDYGRAVSDSSAVQAAAVASYGGAYDDEDWRFHPYEYRDGSRSIS